MATIETAKCRRCRRPLTSSSSRLAGIGPRCAAIEAAEQGLSSKQVEKLRQVIADKGVIRTNRKGVYMVVSADGSSVHRAHVNGNCTCEWGLRRTSADTKVCYAVAAARLAAKPVIRSRPEFTVPVILPAPAPARDVWASLESVGALNPIPAF